MDHDLFFEQKRLFSLPVRFTAYLPDRDPVVVERPFEESQIS